MNAIAAKWDDLIRFVGLMLTTALGREVRQVLPPAERTVLARRQALVDSLVETGALYAELQIPDVAGALSVSADLRSRQVIVSTTIDAPREGTSKGTRVLALLRQLQSAPDALTIEARLAGRSASLAAPLSAVRTEPSLIHPDKGRDIRGFVLSTTSNMGLKRDSGRGSFADGVLGEAENFYEQVLQKLRPWKAAPPQLRKLDKEEPVEEIVADLVGVEPSQIASVEDDQATATAIREGIDVSPA